MRRPLPTEAEAREILARKRTRPKRRAPPPMGRSLAPLIKQLDERFGQGTGQLEARWAEIVGEPLSRVTQPLKLTKGRAGHGGTLELRVVGPAAAFVQHQSAEILQRVNLYLGEGAAEKLRIAQGPVKVRTPKSQPVRKVVDRPLPADQEEALSRTVEAAPSPELRDALLRLGRAALKDGG